MGRGRWFAVPPPHGIPLMVRGPPPTWYGIMQRQQLQRSCWLAGRNYYVRKLALSKKRMESQRTAASHSTAAALQ